MLMMWKIQQAMQDDAIRAARIHPAVHPGNRDEVFICHFFTLVEQVMKDRFPCIKIPRLIFKYSRVKLADKFTNNGQRWFFVRLS